VGELEAPEGFAVDELVVDELGSNEHGRYPIAGGDALLDLFTVVVALKLLSDMFEGT